MMIWLPTLVGHVTVTYGPKEREWYKAGGVGLLPVDLWRSQMDYMHGLKRDLCRPIRFKYAYNDHCTPCPLPPPTPPCAAPLRRTERIADDLTSEFMRVIRYALRMSEITINIYYRVHSLNLIIP